MKPQISLRACLSYVGLLCFSFGLINLGARFEPEWRLLIGIGEYMLPLILGAFLGHLFAGKKGAIIGGIGLLIASLALVLLLNSQRVV